MHITLRISFNREWVNFFFQQSWCFHFSDEIFWTLKAISKFRKKWPTTSLSRVETIRFNEKLFNLVHTWRIFKPNFGVRWFKNHSSYSPIFMLSFNMYSHRILYMCFNKRIFSQGHHYLMTWLNDVTDYWKKQSAMSHLNYCNQCMHF